MGAGALPCGCGGFELAAGASAFMIGFITFFGSIARPGVMGAPVTPFISNPLSEDVSIFEATAFNFAMAAARCCCSRNCC